MGCWEVAQFQWEYGMGKTREVTFSDGATWGRIGDGEGSRLEILQRLGDGGWELVNAQTGVPGSPGLFYWFKRPKA